MILQSSPIKTSIHRGIFQCYLWWQRRVFIFFFLMVEPILQKMSSSIGSIIPFGWKTWFQTSHQMMILAWDDHDISWWSRVLMIFIPNIPTLWSRRIAICTWRSDVGKSLTQICPKEHIQPSTSICISYQKTMAVILPLPQMSHENTPKFIERSGWFSWWFHSIPPNSGLVMLIHIIHKIS